MPTNRTLRISRASLLLMCSCLLGPASHAAADITALRSTVDAAMRLLMEKYDVPGMAVAVTVDGQPHFFSYGLASREDSKAVDENTLFELGSVSKTFNATLATYAQAQGRLALDDHPAKYLPELKGSAIDQASLLQLGTYSAGGLPLQMPEEIASLEQAMAYFRDWKPQAAPGAVRRYSNASIGLFGHIAALALGTDYPAAAQGMLFLQLGLRHTFIDVPASAEADYAWGYNRDNKPVRVNPGVFDAEAYGVKSSAADMIRFVQQNIDPGRLPQAMQRAIKATHVGYYDAGPMVQGLGWEQYPYPVTLARLLDGNAEPISMKANPVRRLAPPCAPCGPTLYNKTGSTGGFGSYLLFVPDRKIGIVMLANRNVPIAARITAAYAVLGELERMANPALRTQ